MMGLLSRQKAQEKIFLHRAKRFLIQTRLLLLPSFDQPCKNDTFSQQRGIPAPFENTYNTYKIPTIPTSVQIAETKSSEHTHTPSQCASLASPFAIHPMMMKKCLSSCAMQCIPPSKAQIQLPPSCSFLTGEASAATRI